MPVQSRSGNPQLSTKITALIVRLLPGDGLYPNLEEF